MAKRSKTPPKPNKVAGKPQLGGMLLEEAVLFLLEGSGYTTVNAASVDPTLASHHGMLWVRGRGSEHQIDAIADFRYPPPFGNPHRLLVEAKMLGKAVGLPVIRNALGVHRDVCEFWVPAPTPQGQPHPPRHHYQHAVFSASGFSDKAQSFAFAQDIYLLDLKSAGFLKDVVDSADDFAGALDRHQVAKHTRLGQLRTEVRKQLQPGASTTATPQTPLPWGACQAEAGKFFDACKKIEAGLLGMLQARLPILLVPNPDQSIEELSSTVSVRIFWDQSAWYLRDTNNRPLFSFTLPRQMWLEFEQVGLMDPEKALDFKQHQLSRIVACHRSRDGSVRFIEFVLDQDWIAKIREHFH